MDRKTVKRIFIFFLIFLPLQYAAVGVVGLIRCEPWPAFVLPAFKSVFSDGDQISVDRIQFYVEDTKNANVIEIDTQTFFPGVDNSQLQGFFRTHFSDSATVAAFSNKTRSWLKKQVDACFPQGEARGLHVRWEKKVFHAGADVAQPSSKTVKSFIISLQSE